VTADLKWELTILEVVQGFYLQLLSETIQDELPPPAGLEVESLRAPDRDAAVLLPAMRRWLKLLDLAVTPEMLRLSLASSQYQDLAEILLCYYGRKQSPSEEDRDKTDFIVTYLYRHPRVRGQWETRGHSTDGVAPISPFETALREILFDVDLPEPSAGESRMLDEFDELAGEAENIHHFDRLIDSCIMVRGRRMKHGFGPAFYQPRSLAIMAHYNDRFGRRFSELFAAAAKQVKSYADEVQRRGGSLSARVNGDITVQQLAQLEESRILGVEYRRAQEHFQHVSRLKKAVDTRNLTRAVDAAVAPPPGMSAPESTAAGPAPAQDTSKLALGSSQPTSRTYAARAAEEGRIQSVAKSIRIWVRAAEESCRQTIPMPFGKFVLEAQELAAYGADFNEEKSFRGDNARALMRMVAILARMQAEEEDFKQRQNSTHLWRPHAESLRLLEELAAGAIEGAGAVLEVANQRGLTEKANLLTATMDRLRGRVDATRELLSEAKPKASGQ